MIKLNQRNSWNLFLKCTNVLMGFVFIFFQACDTVIDSDEQAIRKCYSQYVKQIGNRDYNAAYLMLDTETIMYHQSMLSLIKYATKKSLDSQSIITKLSVLTARYCFEDSVLANMTAYDLYSCGFKKVSSMKTTDTVLENIEIKKIGSSKYANADIANSMNMFKIGIGFNYVNKNWKVNLQRSYTSLDILYKMDLEQKKIDVDDYLYSIIKTEKGIKPISKIWEPIIKSEFDSNLITIEKKDSAKIDNNEISQDSKNIVNKESLKIFVDSYYSLVYSKNCNDLFNFYSPQLEDYFGKKNITADQAVNDDKNYYSLFKIKKVTNNIDWNSFDYKMLGKSNYLVKFNRELHLDREEIEKDTFFKIETTLTINESRKIKSITEKILKRSK